MDARPARVRSRCRSGAPHRRENCPAIHGKPTDAGSVAPFRLITVGGRGPQPGLDLDRPREIEVLDDEVRYQGAVLGRPAQ